MSDTALPMALAYGASWSNDPSKLASQLEVLSVAEEYGIKVLDTARHYVRSLTFAVVYSDEKTGTWRM